jgi:type VI secretion system protein ImpA
MPFRDDLLEPIEGENPSGPNLQYDVKVFDVIKEARQEDDDSIPSGKWERAPKKADRPLVIKIAGDTLAKRSKDLRLAAWYSESLLRKEGFSVLAPSLDYFLKLEEGFWDTVHPEPDEDDKSLDLRIGAMEMAASLMAQSLKVIPLTRDKIDWFGYQDARALGFEADATTDAKRAARADAVARDKLTGEDLQKSIDGTPKAFYAETEGILVQSLALIDDLDRLNEEKYGDDYPSLNKLKSSIEEVKLVVSGILNEKRKTDPDPVEVVEEEVVEGAEEVEGAEGEGGEPGVKVAKTRRTAPSGTPADKEDAYLQVAACAELVLDVDPTSAVPYLLCTALRFGETRVANLDNFSFAVAPPSETRKALRKLASDSNWRELTKLCIATMPEPCGRVWLDLQRYMWLAAQGSGNPALATTVVSTVRSLLNDFPNLRRMTLDDDTSAANSETQLWIDTEVRPQTSE